MGSQSDGRTPAGHGERAGAQPLVTRRRFLGSSSALLAAAGAGAMAGCVTAPQQPNLAPGYTPVPEEKEYPEVPSAPPADAEQSGQLKFFQPHEAEMFDALASRVMPGDSSDPGAHEAGVLYFVDNALATSPAGDGWNEPHYSMGPFAQPYDGSTPPGPDTADTTYVQRGELPRYGYQSRLNPRDVYRKGLAQLDQYANSRFGAAFASLPSDQQDQIVGALDDGSATGFSDPSVDSFWMTVRTHVIQGMFSDPLYGGNRDLAGWKLVGYPGAQRAYTAHDLMTPGTPLQPQGLAQLPHFHAGEPSEGSVIRPVSGSQQYPGNTYPSIEGGGNP